MPVTRINPRRCLYRLLPSLVLMLFLAGCGGAAFTAPSAPDESRLVSAEQALDEAIAANANEFAPQAVDAARRRVVTARRLLYAAARANRDLSEAERARVSRLANAAELDARSALAQTQAGAVETKLTELRDELGTTSNTGDMP